MTSTPKGSSFLRSRLLIAVGRGKTSSTSILNNVRFSDGVRVDLHAMIGSTTMCEKRIFALLDMYGKDTVLACIQEMYGARNWPCAGDSPHPRRRLLGRLGHRRDGTTLDEPVWVRARITVKGDEMTIDLSESDAQRKGFVKRLRRHLWHCDRRRHSVFRPRARRLS